MTQPSTKQVERPYTWRITHDAAGKVNVEIGDDFPANDGPDGLGLTEASYSAIVTQTIGKTLLGIAQHMLSSRFDEDEDYWDYEDESEDDE